MDGGLAQALALSATASASVMQRPDDIAYMAIPLEGSEVTIGNGAFTGKEQRLSPSRNQTPFHLQRQGFAGVEQSIDHGR